jgi:nucleoside-diphosphate-sugar epimerase
MKIHLITGGCGFVGRNLTKRLYKNTADAILLVDNLIIGQDPSKWLNLPLTKEIGLLKIYGKEQRLFFLHQDIRDFFKYTIRDDQYLKKTFGLAFEGFDNVYHLAAMVGGREMIERDPIVTALDLSIDAEFFNWASKGMANRILYPSSSAAYPIHIQMGNKNIPLKEEDINFEFLGKPDMIYGWAKLTGEYLARTTASMYDISIACVRPFSIYGSDQDLSYPIPALVNRFINKENPLQVWGTGQQQRDFVYIDDALEAMELAIEKISDGSAINIATGTPTSFLSIINILSEVSGHYPDILALEDKPVGVLSRFCDPGLAQCKLGWKANTTLEEGLSKVYHDQKHSLVLKKSASG